MSVSLDFIPSEAALETSISCLFAAGRHKSAPTRRDKNMSLAGSADKSCTFKSVCAVAKAALRQYWLDKSVDEMVARLCVATQTIRKGQVSVHGTRYVIEVLLRK